MSVNKWVVGVCAGVVACGSSAVFAQSHSSVSIPNSAVQTPSVATSGLTLTQAGGSFNATVYTKGFYFCNDVPEGGYGNVLTLAHEDQTLSPAHPWVFPPVGVVAFTYNSTGLVFPYAVQTSLECSQLQLMDRSPVDSVTGYSKTATTR